MSLFCGYCNVAFPDGCKCGKIGLYKSWAPEIEKVVKLQKENAKLRECAEFYTHEKPREGYGCEKVAGVMSGHRYDIACGACNEENKGKKARETLKELESGE